MVCTVSSSSAAGILTVQLWATTSGTQTVGQLCHSAKYMASGMASGVVSLNVMVAYDCCR